MDNKDYKNTKIVKVKTTRYCKQCNSEIAIGNECLTTNKKYEGRTWYCLACIEAFEQLESAQANLDAVSVGDEGAAMYYLDLIEEAKAQLCLVENNGDNI